MVPLRILFYAIALMTCTCLQAQVTDDSVMYQRDSAIVADDPTTVFFQQAEKTKSPEKIVLVTKTKKTVTLKKFLFQLNGAEKDFLPTADYGFSDLDGDGKKELLTWSHTGGAHCCDEVYVFKYIASNKYQHVGRIFAGHTVIDENKEFNYSLHEHFGYFFTCFACGYTDTTDAGPIDMSRFTIRYKGGKLSVVPGTAELKSMITDNLGKLAEQPYERLEDAGSFDNGLRKEFAFNLASYYYSFGKNMLATQALFNKYYRFPDAKKVWAAFAETLRHMRSQSDF